MGQSKVNVNRIKHKKRKTTTITKTTEALLKWNLIQIQFVIQFVFKFHDGKFIIKLGNKFFLSFFSYPDGAQNFSLNTYTLNVHNVPYIRIMYINGFDCHVMLASWAKTLCSEAIKKEEKWKTAIDVDRYLVEQCIINCDWFLFCSWFACIRQ